jgi:hypothetical protein
MSASTSAGGKRHGSQSAVRRSTAAAHAAIPVASVAAAKSWSPPRQSGMCRMSRQQLAPIRAIIRIIEYSSTTRQSFWNQVTAMHFCLFRKTQQKYCLNTFVSRPSLPHPTSAAGMHSSVVTLLGGSGTADAHSFQSGLSSLLGAPSLPPPPHPKQRVQQHQARGQMQ